MNSSSYSPFGLSMVNTICVVNIMICWTLHVFVSERSGRTFILSGAVASNRNQHHGTVYTDVNKPDALSEFARSHGIVQ